VLVGHGCACTAGDGEGCERPLVASVGQPWRSGSSPNSPSTRAPRTVPSPNVAPRKYRTLATQTLVRCRRGLEPTGLLPLAPQDDRNVRASAPYCCCAADQALCVRAVPFIPTRPCCSGLFCVQICVQLGRARTQAPEKRQVRSVATVGGRSYGAAPGLGMAGPVPAPWTRTPARLAEQSGARCAAKLP
jgi:hypothetical protein